MVEEGLLSTGIQFSTRGRLLWKLKTKKIQQYWVGTLKVNSKWIHDQNSIIPLVYIKYPKEHPPNNGWRGFILWDEFVFSQQRMEAISYRTPNSGWSGIPHQPKWGHVPPNNGWRNRPTVTSDGPLIPEGNRPTYSLEGNNIISHLSCPYRDEITHLKHLFQILSISNNTN